MERTQFPFSRRDPRAYNAPLIVNKYASINSDDSAELLSPSDNQNGRFLGSVAAFATRSTSFVVPILALNVGPRKPSGFSLEPEASTLAFSTGLPGSWDAAGLVTSVVSILNFSPFVPVFIPPGHGVYLTAYVSTSGVIRISARLYNDPEQAGR
jgi:hypothetical protein